MLLWTTCRVTDDDTTDGMHADALAFVLKVSKQHAGICCNSSSELHRAFLVVCIPEKLESKCTSHGTVGQG